jgi:hypothetical protein
MAVNQFAVSNHYYHLSKREAKNKPAIKCKPECKAILFLIETELPHGNHYGQQYSNQYQYDNGENA